MCYNCGCGIPDDNMGSDLNITNVTFKKLAQEQHKSEEEIKEMVFEQLKTQKLDASFEHIFDDASKAWGQPIDEAKKETLKLLKQELQKK